MPLSLTSMISQYGIRRETQAFLDSPKKMWIGGKCVGASDGGEQVTLEPVTNAPLSTVPSATLSDLDDAVNHARNSLRNGWGKMLPTERQNCLLKLADLMVEHKKILGEIETLDNGKALVSCIEYDVISSVEVLRYMAGLATKKHGRTHDVSVPGNHFAFTLAEPIGVVGALVPWNWPLAMAVWKLAAPLAAGCTIVIKPASETPLSLLYLAALMEQSGFPAGTINVITGSGSLLGDGMTSHSGIDKISFTGSTEVGRQVGKSAGWNLKPVTLELGGKSPMIVFGDADLDAVVEAVRGSVFYNSGQVCSAGSRLYAPMSVIDKLSGKLSDLVKTMKVAPGLDPQCEVGPVISPRAYRRIQNCINEGIGRGAQVVCQGKMDDQWAQSNAFIAPTVLLTNDNADPLSQEEIFGPVLTIIPFENEDDALALANDNPYALGASVWTQDINRAMKFVKGLDSGTVWVNAHDLGDASATFGGFKESGYGKDLGPEQFSHYIRSKAVWIAGQ